MALAAKRSAKKTKTDAQKQAQKLRSSRNKDRNIQRAGQNVHERIVPDYRTKKSTAGVQNPLWKSVPWWDYMPKGARAQARRVG